MGDIHLTGVVGDVAVGAWCDRVRTLLADGGVVTIVCDIDELRGRAVAVVDALARMQLVARRCGGEIRLRQADDGLLALLDLAGLAGVIVVADHPEEGEQ